MFKLRYLTLLPAGWLFCAPGLAQALDDLPASADTIVVTASRAPLTITNVGSATTIITREQIERQQARYVTDLLRTVPGFAVSHSGTTGSQTQVRVRGAEANHVLVLIDGVRVNDPASGDEFRWELLSTSNVERIEIVRGPQSSLWGSDALAGVVHVITRAGGDQPEVDGYAEGGSFSTLNAGLRGGLAGAGWQLAFGLENLSTDGSNVSRIGNEMDGSDMTTASLSGQYRPSSDLTLDFGMRTVDAYAQFDPVDFFVTGLPVDGNVATDTWQTNMHAGSLLSTFDGKVQHRLNMQFLDTNNRNLVDNIEDSRTASDQLTLAYQSDLQLGSNMLSLALEHQRTRFEQHGEIGFGDPNQQQESSINSIIADYQGRSIARLSWLLSARYDDNSDFENALTGRLAVAYEIDESTILRSNIGTGQKAPTFIERFGYYPGQFLSNPELQPEKSTSYDIGIERRMLDDALELQLTIFRQDLENEINGFVFDPDTFFFTAENMDSDSSRAGVEVAAHFGASDALQLSGSYTYTDSSEFTAQVGDAKELRRPRHAGSLSANYRFPDDRSNLAFVADYGGSRADIFYPPYPEPSEIVTLDSYWLLSATFDYKFNKATNIYVRATNLLDDDYEQVFGYQTTGRSAYLGVRVSFGP